MELNKKQTEFWAILLIVCLVVSVAILLVDFQIKQAILEESNRLRMKVEEWEVRQSGLRKAKERAGNDSANHRTIPGDVLVDSTTGMETGNVPNGSEETAGQSPRSRQDESG